MGQLHVGTSGFCYRWPHFYGEDRKATLLGYAAKLDALEVNASHYRLQRPETFAAWRESTPPNFVFAIKANRYLTHLKKLIDPEGSIRLERERAVWLGEKLKVVLWQLPKNFRLHDERLDRWLAALDRHWPDVRHTLEPRDESWFTGAVADKLAAHRVAVCISDAPTWPRWDAVTTDFVYVRLHGHTRLYRSRYDPRGLMRWAERIEEWLASGRDVHVYFDNTDEGHAPVDALRLLKMLGRARTDAAPTLPSRRVRTG